MSTQYPSTEELLSAYLDDELSTSQKVDVEQALASQPELRKLHDELLAIREGLKCVAKRPAPEKFVDSVLARIQVTPVSVSGQDGPLGARRESGWKRGVVWSAMVIAAAVVVMMFLPDESEDGPAVTNVPDRISEPLETAETEVDANQVDDGNAIGARAVADDQPVMERADIGEEPQLSQLRSQDALGPRHADVDAFQPTENKAAISADMNASRIVRLSLTQERTLRKLASEHNIRFVGEDVPTDFSKKLLLVESNPKAIDEVMQKLETGRLPSIDSDDGNFASVGDTGQRFSLKLDLDPNLQLQEVRRYRRSKPGENRVAPSESRTLFILE